MTHYGLKEGYWLINGDRAYLQRILGKWHYFIVLTGWKRLHDSDRVQIDWREHEATETN